MSIKQIIEIGCIKENLTFTGLAKKLGTSKQNLSNKLLRNNMKFSDIQEICNILNIEIKFIKDGKEL